MDYFTRQTFLKLAFFIFTVVRSSCALLERAVEDPVHPNPLDSSPVEDMLLHPSAVSFCDFESPCSWTLSNHSAGGDWYVTSPQQYRANRWGVQPIKDYSTGKSEGHFLLLKPTSTHFAAGRCSFHLISPVVLSSGPLCRLRLARFQPEPHTGNISAFVKHTDHSVIKPIALTVKGTGRSQWEVLEAVIGQLDESFHVTVQYSSCSSHEVGFLAFDSLELKDCVMGDDYLDLGSDCEKYSSLHCHSGGCIEKRRVCDFHTDCPQGEDEGLICNSLPLGSYCSFELDSCGWSVADSLSSWRLVSGQQLNEDTDLLGTTLQNTQGHFLFLKVRGRGEESEALVQSPALPSTVSNQDCQLQFSLYLCGDFNGTVLLSVVENGMSASPLIWERSGHWKDAWQEISLPITGILKGHAYSELLRDTHALLLLPRNPLTHNICLGESSVIEDGFDSDGSALKWAGGGGGGGGATYVYRMENGEPVPLLIAAGGGGKAYLEDPESSLDQIFLEQYENDTSAPGVNGKSGAAGGGGGWSDLSSLHWAGKCLVEGGQGGSSCPEALSVLGWATFGGFGGGGGACTAGGGGGGYRGGDAPLLDGITADGQDGVSFVHPMGKIFLQPLA
ncbi:ALK tyrosine kinase receptor-like, partial [Sinocyclocheilus grahami]|uniref:ALK tyrosine kinase receptor-like n=1 Tax=Sinocyclocheilus grahami TaxID=75366 RepID=UPI0007AC9CF8